MIDLAKLKALAEAAPKSKPHDWPLGAIERFIAAANPQTVLALIEAIGVATDAIEKARITPDCFLGTALARIDAILNPGSEGGG